MSANLWTPHTLACHTRVIEGPVHYHVARDGVLMECDDAETHLAIPCTRCQMVIIEVAG